MTITEEAPAAPTEDPSTPPSAPSSTRRSPVPRSGQLRQAQPAVDGPQPGDVHRRGGRGAHHGAVRHATGAREHRPAERVRRSWWPSGCGPPCCSPTSPRPWPRGGARPRPPRCARPGPRPSARVRLARRRPSRRSSTELDLGDLCVVAAGEVIPGDGDVVEGIATVDESAITGESAPVIRESGGDRSAVTGGTRVLSDEIVVQISARPGETFMDRMIALVEGADRQKTPNEIALSILLAGPDHHLPAGRGDAAAVRHLLGGRAVDRRARRPARLPHPDDHRRPAVGHRHRRHGPAGAAQRAGHVRPGGRGRGRREHAAARQDRHHHVRRPSGRRVHPGPRRDRAASWPRPHWPRRWPTRRPRALDRRAGHRRSSG